eukprot:jgi/Tetstr1/421818/TSEL_012719.t1
MHAACCAAPAAHGAVRLNSWPASRALPTRSRNAVLPAPRRLAVAVRAQGDGERKGTDWDKAWASFKEGAGLQDPSDMVGTATPPPEPTGPDKRLQKEIRAQERVLLDVWSTETFMKAGAGTAVLLFILFVFVIGPPPSDGRCLLPWC